MHSSVATAPVCLVGWLVVLRLKSVGCYVHVDYKRNNTMVRLLLLR